MVVVKEVLREELPYETTGAGDEDLHGDGRQMVDVQWTSVLDCN